MDAMQRLALDTAKEIVVAKMSNSTIRTDADGGKAAADFFEEIYNRVLSIAKNENYPFCISAKTFATAARASTSSAVAHCFDHFSTISISTLSRRFLTLGFISMFSPFLFPFLIDIWPSSVLFF